MNRHNSLCRFLCSVCVLILPVFISAQLKVTHLTTEHMTNPSTVDELHPRLSWVNEVQSDKVRGEAQTAYRIVVASSAEKLEVGDFDLWDTGKVKDDCSTLIPYNGKPLTSGQDCFWKVQTWNRKGKVSAWSEPASWGMGLLSPDEWKAQWICAGH